MSIVITEILGTDSFSGSRIVLNANFQTLKGALDTLGGSPSVYNMDLSFASAGNIDVSAASSGQIKAKGGSFNTIVLPASGSPTITLTGSTGAMTGTTLSLGTSITVPAVNADNLTLSSLGNSVFNGGVTFNALVKLQDGVAINEIDLGVTTTHTVLFTDCVLLFDAGVATLTLTPDAGLVDGHVITLISYNASGGDKISATNLLGFTVDPIFVGPTYRSAITLMYKLAAAKWIVLSSSNMTIV